MDNIKIGVYGTLKPGHGNHRYIVGAKYLGPARAPDDFVVVDLGPYPAAVVRDAKLPGHSNAHAPVLQVYEVDEAQRRAVDTLEGHPHYYKREEVETDVGKVWMYVLPLRSGQKGVDIVEDGVWKPAQEELKAVEEFNKEAS